MAGSKGKIKFGGNPKSIIKQGGSPKTDIRQGGDPESIMQMNPSWRLASCDVDPSIGSLTTSGKLYFQNYKILRE